MSTTERLTPLASEIGINKYNEKRIEREELYERMTQQQKDAARIIENMLIRIGNDIKKEKEKNYNDKTKEVKAVASLLKEMKMEYESNIREYQIYGENMSKLSGYFYSLSEELRLHIDQQLKEKKAVGVLELDKKTALDYFLISQPFGLEIKPKDEEKAT